MTVDLETKLAAVQAYFGDSTWWDRVTVQGLTPAQIEGMYSQLPASSFSVDVTPSGLVLGRQYENPFELPVIPGSDWDSNIPGGSYEGGNTFTGSIPGSIVVDPTTGTPVRMQGGAMTTTGSQIPAIVDRVSLAVTGVNIGAKLGLKIDEALYQLDPAWWDANLPGLNPQTWNSLVGVNPVGDFFLRTIFGINGNNMTGYISEEVLAYYYQMMRDAGFFGGDAPEFQPPSQLSNVFTGEVKVATGNVRINLSVGYSDYLYALETAQYIVLWDEPNNNSLSIGAFSREPFYVYEHVLDKGTDNITYTSYKGGSAFTCFYSGDTCYERDVASYNKSNISNLNDLAPLINHATRDIGTQTVGTCIFDGTQASSDRPEGITDMTGATQYPPTNITGTTTQEVLAQLRQQYPDLFTDPITESTMQEDGTVTETTYVPIPWVTEGLRPQTPTTLDERTQGDLDIDPGTGDEVLPTTPQDEPTDVPPTGEGDTPPIITPTGSASSLWAVYNPTQAQLNSFGSWLWSSNFVEQIKKLFADPMQAIIGVHKVFASPSTGGAQTIKCGYLDSGVSASVVTNQYTTIDCGSAKLREYFGNVFDYEPYTKVSIFLPFIGVVPLNVSEVMRSTISVKYRVDVITGACLAEVSVSRDSAGGVLYTYGGSAIVTYPISSGSYVGAVQSALSTAIGIGLAASGGASIGAVAGLALSGLSGAKTQVQHSGQFSGSSGAMGGKKPYLIVTRPQTYTPTKINEYKGLPSTSIDKLSKYTGYVKVNEVHITSTKAYDNEIQEIESLLKSGVII